LWSRVIEGYGALSALTLKVDVSNSETQGHLSGCGEKSSRTWSSLYLDSRDKGIV
jgi:hypothetical protein